MKILAIETSCDETAIAVLSFSGEKTTAHIRILTSIVSSQAALHTSFGGVVPNLAKREHEKNLVPILLQALHESQKQELRIMNYELRKRARRKIHDSKYMIHHSFLEREPELLTQFKEKILPLPIPDIDAIAVTNGPGLAPALWVGVNFARALSVLWHIPLIPVNHMEGHLYSALLEAERENPKSKTLNPKQIQNSKFKTKNILKFRVSNLKFPTLALLVSGGHTELVLMRGYGNYRVIGETLDDAAGEAFDKVARMLGLEYPGGPVISAIAEMKLKVKSLKFKVALPRPMIHSKDFNFSFSGLKTAVLYLTRNLGDAKTKKYTPLIAREFQQAVVDVLVAKTIRACRVHKIKTLLLGGGVAANRLLRATLDAQAKKIYIPLLTPNFSLTGDNAIMIALAAYITGTKKAPNKVGAVANARL